MSIIGVAPLLSRYLSGRYQVGGAKSSKKRWGHSAPGTGTKLRQPTTAWRTALQFSPTLPIMEIRNGPSSAFPAGVRGVRCPRNSAGRSSSTASGARRWRRRPLTSAPRTSTAARAIRLSPRPILSAEACVTRRKVTARLDGSKLGRPVRQPSACGVKLGRTMRRPRASVPACQAGLRRCPCLGPGITIRRYWRHSFTPGDTCFRFDPASALRLGCRCPGERAAWSPPPVHIHSRRESGSTLPHSKVAARQSNGRVRSGRDGFG
jgi:hypothetical protein